MDRLPAGTRIRIKGKYGTIISSEIVPAIPCGKIAVHTVLLTAKAVRTYGYHFKMIAINEKPKKVNYTAIETID